MGSSESNGIVEQGVQAVEGHLKVLLLAFEGRLGVRLDVKEMVVTFMPEHAAYLLNRLGVGKAG